MIIYIPAVGALLLALLLAYLFLGNPVGNSRSIVVTLINVLLFIFIVYLILRLFGVIAF